MEPPIDPLEVLVQSPAGAVFAFVLGALFGSFANVCIERIPRGMSVVRPPSHCFSCGAQVAWYDNLPIFSYVLLRGRCRRCGSTYSPRYLLIEAATGALFAAVWIAGVQLQHAWDPPPHRLARFAAHALFVFVMVVVAMIDLDHKRIPDKITYPGIPMFLGLGLLLRDQPAWESIVGVVVGYGVVRAIADGYYFLTKREGMGYGDGKLLAMIGGLLGFRAVLFSLFGGSLLGSVIGVSVIAWRRRRGSRGDADPKTPVGQVEIPFGPFLIAAALVYLFFAPWLRVGFESLWFADGESATASE
jgi:leader peptidase (prepilin peptidase)/N-methyltransferase